MDFEVIVIDDGSTDRTPDVVQPFLSDRRVQYHCTEHLGQPAAKNAGIRLARAPLIAFLDADDVWLPSKLQQQVRLFQYNPRLGVAYSGRCTIDPEGRQLVSSKEQLYRGHVLPEMFRTNFVCFSSCMVHLKVFDKVGLFDERLPLAIDYDLWLRAARYFDFDYVDEPLVKYRRGHANLSQRGQERLLIALGIMRRFLDEVDGRGLIPASVVRRSFAETYAHVALLQRNGRPWKAIGWYLRSLAASPIYWPAWSGIVSAVLPDRARRLLRQAVGRPADWSQPAMAASPSMAIDRNE